jgi:hypothetical protein
MAGEKAYRIAQIEGKITWRAEEMWDGGVTRGPFGTRDAAKMAEERFAQENGIIDDLVLKEVVGEEGIPKGAFEKAENGSWRCLKPCAVDIDNKTLEFLAGMDFETDIPYLGIDVVKWLDENYASQERD